MKKNLITIFSLLAFLSFSFSQDAGLVNDPNFLQNMRTIDPGSNAKTVGSKYLNEDFTPIKILNFKGNLIYSGRYNAFNGDMEVKLNDDKIIALATNGSKNYDVLFIKENKNYRNFTYFDKNGNERRGFLVVLNDGKNAKLLKLEKIRYIPAEKGTTSYDKDKPAKYKKEKDAYFLSYNGEVKPLPTKKKDVINHFKDNSKAVADFIKKNKIKLSREEDLIKFTTFVNGL